MRLQTSPADRGLGLWQAKGGATSARSAVLLAENDLIRRCGHEAAYRYLHIGARNKHIAGEPQRDKLRNQEWKIQSSPELLCNVRR